MLSYHIIWLDSCQIPGNSRTFACFELNLSQAWQGQYDCFVSETEISRAIARYVSAHPDIGLVKGTEPVSHILRTKATNRRDRKLGVLGKLRNLGEDFSRFFHPEFSILHNTPNRKLGDKSLGAFSEVF